MRHLLGFLLSLCLGTTAFANNEEFAVSSDTGANIYLIVSKGSGLSTREPGFYTRNGTDWAPAVLGDIVLHPQRGHILLQLDSREDRRSQSLAIIDGYLTLFSLDSKPDQKDSYVRFGSLETPIMHPITQTPIFTLPLLQSEDIAIFEHTMAGETLLYVSMRMSPTLGQTYVVKIGPVKDGKIQVLSPLVLINQKFLTESELGYIAREGSTTLVSSTIVDDFIIKNLERELGKHSGLLRQWKSDVKTNWSQNGHRISLQDYSVENRLVPSYPMAKMMTVGSNREPYQLKQVIDPIKQQRFLANSHDVHNVLKITGVVDLDHEGNPLYRQTHDIHPGNYITRVFETISINGQLGLYMYPRNAAGQPQFLTNQIVKDVSIFFIAEEPIPEIPGVVNYYLLSSVLHQTGHQMSTVIRLRVNQNSGHVLASDLLQIPEINSQFFSQKDLEDKMKPRWTQDKSGGFLEIQNPNDKDSTVQLNLLDTVKLNVGSIIGQLNIIAGLSDFVTARLITGEYAVVSLKSRKTVFQVANFENVEAIHLKRPDEPKSVNPNDPVPGRRELIVLNGKSKDGNATYFMEVLNVGTDKESTEIYRAEAIDKMDLSIEEIHKRIKNLGINANARWMFDLSEKNDEVKLADIERTVRTKNIQNDSLGEKNAAMRLEASELELAIQRLFPDMVVVADKNGILTLNSQDGNALGQYKIAQLPAPLNNEDSIYRFYEVKGVDQPIQVAVIPLEQQKDQPIELLGVICYKDENGMNQYRVSRFAGSQIISDTKPTYKNLEEFHFLPVISPTETGVKKVEILLETHTKKTFGASDDPTAPIVVKKKKKKKEKLESVYRDMNVWTISLGEHGAVSTGVNHLGFISDDYDLDLFLAKYKGEWFWVSYGHDSFLSKGLNLQGLSLKLGIHPNQSQGRLKRADIEYLVPPEKRPVGDSSGRFFFDGNWKASPKEVADEFSQGEKSSPYSEKLFSGIINQINQYLSNPGPYKPMVLVVPKEIKTLLMNYLGSVYAEGRPGSKWSKDNEAMRVFTIPKQPYSQYQAVDNIEVMASVDPENNLLIGNLATLSQEQMAVPVNPDQLSLYSKAKVIEVVDAQSSSPKHPKVDSEESEETAQPVEVVESTQHFPHFSFLMASQGNSSISYEDSRKLTKALRFPAILFGTKSEWDAFIDNNENEFINYEADKWFDVVKVENPSLENKVQLLSSVIDTQQIRSLRYRFDTTGISKKNVDQTPEEAQKALLRHAVNRIETLSRSSEMNPFSLYLKFLSIFVETLVRDKETRRTQVVNKAFVERVLTQIFNVPLNRSFLPEDDPLYILSKPDAPIRLQDAGYNGPMALKQQILEVLRSPLTPSQARTIPSSMILAGDTGTGKSFLFQSLVKMLGLKLYDFHAVSEQLNEDANAMIIRADKLVVASDKVNGAGNALMTVDDAIAHIDHFISLPQGYRGYIFIDDLHGAPNEVRQKLLVYLRGLFEATNGIYTTKSTSFRTGNREVRTEETSRPIRGLNLVAAMNFTENVELLEKFTKRGEKPTLEQIILATLSTPNHNIETSFLKRWGAIIPLSQFPIEAKGPGVMDGFRKKMQALLELNNKFAFLSPDLVAQIANSFSNMDARSFLTESSNALYDLAGNDINTSPVRVLAPNHGDLVELHASVPQGPGSSDLSKYVYKHTQVVDLAGGYEGRLHLMKIASSSFRLSVLERFVQALQEHPQFSYSQNDQRQHLYPVLFALNDYIQDAKSLPLSVLNLDPAKFGIHHRDEKLKFAAKIKAIDISHGGKPFYPFSFNDKTGKGLAYSEMTSDLIQVASQPTRRSVLNQYVIALQPVLEEELATQMRLPDLINFPNRPESWIEGLTRAEPGNEKVMGKKIIDLYQEFRQALFADELAGADDSNRPLTSYASARLFLYVMDRAISKLAWTESMTFFASAIDVATEDMVLSQSPGFHYLMNESRRSLFYTRTPDYLLAVINNFPAFGVELRELHRKQRGRFNEDCEYLLGN